VSIVGARHPTELGKIWVREAVEILSSKGVVLVSGGARGIDAEVHLATLRFQGETVAFLPGCVDRPYPLMNSYLFDEMTERGALISEFLPGTIVCPENFHRRNRLIAGCSGVVVIVEAALKSGTLMTAHRALDENREVLVVPGPPMVPSYAGSLELLNQGAGLARTAEDVLKLL
jgi:DNA processing protein